MRLLLLLLISISVSFLPLRATAADDQHSYVGDHGMVLFAADDILLASHLPLYQPPHNYQLIYQITLPPTEHKVVLATLQKRQQMTLLPQQFDLTQLIKGQSITVNAALYHGHFERGGSVWFDKVPVNFARQLYIRPIQQPGTASEARYDVLKINSSYFLIHQIAANPSYDQILRTERPISEPLILKAPADVTALQQLNAMGIEATEVYLETADFQ
ncbi:MAG: hypothetical protein CML20_08035 [Rheinheimera sp.]|uniref:hypothetical protein n=1 Tax=Arsukibacterium sp. UBA3155 TaxID=1946058 RepID=UPI000C97F275|nr:hypothetical protein [Arsukibacterium sp. UBA3155]MAD74724.1 hypothetical protein [Rheinheimera sp.]|tara:strand:+ start:5206 stop:5853 length:648 start_codon:yes stop_codon:yes gene_type:complete